MPAPNAIHKSLRLLASMRPDTPQLRSFYRKLSYGFGSMPAHIPTISADARSHTPFTAPWFPTASTGGVEGYEKMFCERLDIFPLFGKITNGSVLPKVSGRAGDSQSGLK